MARTKKPDVAELFKLADQYKQNLLNKNLLIVGENDEGISYIEARFLDYHFKHLTGVRTVTSMPAALFFRKCISRRLSCKELMPDSNGLARIKMQAARTMFENDLSAVSFGKSNNSRIYLHADIFAGHHWACIGFEQNHPRWCDPVTMLRSPVTDEVLPADLYGIIAILSKSISEANYATYAQLPSSDEEQRFVERYLTENGLRLVLS